MERSSVSRYRGKHAQRKGAARRSSAAGREGRAVVRLAVCGLIFVFLVAVKLLFPQTVSRLAQTAGDLIGRDADFKEAFAAMGRAVSGEEPVGDSLQDAYTAVFNPGEDDAVLASGTAAVSDYLDPAARLIQHYTLELPDPDEEETAGSGEAENTGLAAEQVAASLPVEETVAVQEPPEEPATDQEVEETATAAASQVYTMPALPENASLEQRNLGFAHTSPIVAPLTSPFGWREHPVSGGTKFHYGVDLGAETGTDICAFADGEVYATGDSSSLGYYIMIQHADGYMTLYAHCSKITVTSGAVTMGQKIAEVGETGIATGPHLHFELHHGDLYLNPIYYVEVR